MEDLDLMEWIKDNYGSCRGDGSGYGSCRSDGSYGYGYGYGCGCGYVDGSGSCCGFGCSSSGSVFSDNLSLKQIGEDIIYNIDGVPTIISHIRKNVAKGFILNLDLSKKSCYIVKGNGLFAHGKTLKEAQNALVAKYMETLNEYEVVEKFLSEFKKEEKYKGEKFFEWHHFLTGSCLMGREQFVKNHGIDLEHEFTVEEFFDICRDSYGWNIIEKLEKEWERNKQK